METVWDWVTVFAFAGLVTLMLQRSSEEVLRDKLWHYAPPAIGCAIANQVGNAAIEDGQTLYHVGAIAIMVAVGVYVIKVLKPELPRI